MESSKAASNGAHISSSFERSLIWGWHVPIVMPKIYQILTNSCPHLSRYQVRFSVLQAGDFGTPQSRRRLIYVAALSGRTLPEFPLPTHHFHKRPQYMKLPTWGNAPIAIREDGCAPHFEVTVRDAISDLPQFDWYVVMKTFATAVLYNTV